MQPILVIILLSCDIIFESSRQNMVGVQQITPGGATCFCNDRVTEIWSCSWKLCWSLLHTWRTAFSNRTRLMLVSRCSLSCMRLVQLDSHSHWSNNITVLVIGTVNSVRVAMFPGNTRAQAGLWSGQEAGAEVKVSSNWLLPKQWGKLTRFFPLCILLFKPSGFPYWTRWKYMRPQ